MDTASIDLFWSQGRRESSWSSVTSRPPVSLHDPLPVLDLDALQVALTRLDHSPQKGKAYVGRSGALSHRRPPSRSSRRSSADSLQLLLDQQDLDTDLVIPRVVNIEVQFEGKAKDRKQKERQVAGKQTGSFKEHRDERQFACKQIRDVKDHREETDINHTQAEDTKEHKKQRHFPCRDTRDFKNHSLSFREELNDALEAKHKPERKQEESNKPRGLDARQEIRRKLFENRYRRSDASVGGSNPLLNNFSSESEESFRRIKEEVARLAAKRRSSSDISDSRTPSDYSFSCGSAQEDERRESLRRWSEERESVFDSASLLLDKNLEENRSSSEADVVISDRESIADSGLVNRRTVITINEKKSKSASSLTPEEPTTPLWVRDLQTRRSLRGKDQAPPRLIPIEIDQDFEGGINVSIVSQTEPNRKDSTSRMYVRQSDSENRPSRASAFNVRRTIEKRQIQQERRERRALREKIREQLRSLSEGRERKDSSTSHGSSVHLSQNSVRSKSMSSLDQDQEDFRSESPLFKVQSSPTLEKEKEEVRSYLFGVSNLTESGDVSPTSREDTQLTSRDTAQPSDNQQEPRKTYGFVRPQPWQWTQSWDSLKTAREEVNERKSRKVSKSVDSVQNSSDVGSRQSSFQSSILELGSSKPSWQDYNLRQTEHRTHLLSSVISPPLDSLESTSSCPPVLSTLDPDTAKRDNLSPVREEFSPNNPPVPPPRRNRLSSSTGQITLEEEDKPNWIRLAKERRSLRAAKQVDQLSDRASTASKEPEWVARARKKLESLNVTLTSTTDFSCASSCVTESSSAWSRGGLDALDDLKEETSRIGEELAEEASARVNEELGLHKDSSRMLEHNTERSREPSAERPRVSFEPSATEASDGDSSRRLRTRKPQKDEVRFGDLKHDWGGAQTKATKTSNGKQKEMRFGEIQVKETLPEPPERTKAMRFGDHVPSSSTQKAQSNSSATNGSRPVMRFGDTPLNLFPASEPKGPQSSSKFESVAGPDPTKMTAEQLNQNVEEYDFPIPTGNEDASELMRFLEESLKRTEVVPEVVILEDHRPKPKSILKRRSVENVLHELKREERGEVLQKVEHRKSASFDWDSVGKGADAGLDNMGHTRNIVHRLSREHHKPHSDTLHKAKPQPQPPQQHQHNPTTITTTTATTTATNGSFFNVKLRHVSSNKREPAVTNEPLRFHSEHSLHRRPQAVCLNTERHSGDFSSLNTFTSSREIRLEPRRISTTGGDSHGSSSASSQESLSDSGGVLSHCETDRAVSEVKDDDDHRYENNKTTIRKLRTTDIPRRDEDRRVTKRDTSSDHDSRRDLLPKPTVSSTITCTSRKVVTVGSKSVRELLQRVQEPPSPAWGTCRTGRGLATTEPKDDINVPLHGDPLVSASNVDEMEADFILTSSARLHDSSDTHNLNFQLDLNSQSNLHPQPHPHLQPHLFPQSHLLSDVPQHRSETTSSLLGPEDNCAPGAVDRVVLVSTDESLNKTDESVEGEDSAKLGESSSESENTTKNHQEMIDANQEDHKEEKQENSKLEIYCEEEATVSEQLGSLDTHQDLLTPHQSTLTIHPAYLASYQLTPVVVQSPATIEEEQRPSLHTASSNPSSTQEDNTSSTTPQIGYRHQTPDHFDDCPGPSTYYHHDGRTTFSSHHGAHASFNHHRGSHASFTHHEGSHVSFTHHEGSHASSLPRTEGPTTKLPAKMFSFTFSADQKTRPETFFTELEEDSLVHLKTQKEVENIRRTEGMKTFTVITNPRDVLKHDSHSDRTSVNGHVITPPMASHTPPMASHAHLSKSKSNKIGPHSQKLSEQCAKSSGEVPIKPYRMKTTSQSHTSGGERRKIEDKAVEGSHHKHKVHQVTVEVVNDEDQRKISSKRREEERRRSSLLEWEALQRQRLEDEEKNRINKNLSMKPVSTKIKELVKMHGSFMSMFSKDKKTDINGTVDGKDDIVFRKMSSENLHSDLKNDSIKEIPMVPMKSPYIVKKLLSPTKHTSSYEESQRRSRRDSSKSPTRRSSSATRKDSSKTRASEDKKDHTSHRILTESNWKNSATNRPTTSAIGQKLRSSSSPSSRRRKTPITSSSPDRSERSREKDTLSKPRGSHSAEPRASESRLRARDRDDSSKSSKKFSPPVPPKPINLHEKTQSYPSPYLEVKRRESADREKDKDKCQTSFSFEKRMSEGRSSIKDPKNRKEWLNKMLNTLSSEQISSLDRTSPTSPSAATATPPLSPSKLRSNRNIYRDSLQTEEDPDEMLQNFTPVPPARRSTPSSKLSAKPQHSTPTKYTTPSTSIASPKASASSSIPVTPIKPAVPPKYLSTFLAMSSTDHVDITCASKTNASFPSTPTSLRSSVREALQSDQSQVCNGRRGPVSLSSILGDCSSRSSSMTSTPLTSPRATPERVLKRDSLDLTSKLDVILESSLRDGRRVTVPGDEHKENIAPSPSTKRNKEPCEKDIEEKESSNVPLASSFTSSFRLRDRSEERRRGTRREDEDRSPQREIKSSWQPSVHKPFTFTKPSVTLKAMTSGVDPQRVATSKTSSLHKDNVPHTSYLSSCLVPGHHDNKKYSPDKNNSIVRKSEVRDNPDSFTSRYAHERLSLRGRVPESPYKGATENSSAVGGEGRRLSSKGYEPLSSRFSKERSSLRSREPSERSTPDRDTGPVSLSTILSKDDGTKDSPIPEEPSNFQFKPNLSFSEEMNDLTHRYRTDMAIRRSSSEDTSSGRLPHATTYDSDDVFDNNSTQDGGDKTRESSLEPQSKESSPAREVRVVRQCKNNKEKSPGRRAAKESSPSPSGPKGLPKTSSTSPSKSRSRVVRRNSSLKRYRPEDQGGSVRIKKERKDSEDDPADHKDETIVQNDAGWTKTKTTVRRARLGSSEKARQIVRTNSGKTRKEKTFKANASKDLEDWAAGTSVQGKLMKKEGQKFSHETEEEVKGGQRTSKSVVRRVVRRGSRRLSGGGELLTETKETSSTGASKDGAVVGEGSGREGGGQEVQKKQEEDENEGAVVVAVEDGVSRRMKTKTDGERYMTQSVCDKGGRTTYTTEGVNNKTTNSLEVIGGDDFDAKREVQGRTGHRVVVERTKDNLGRPSTVVKKITSQSRVVITKTKRKLPVVV
ncbi:uncharacterized protein LOC121875150 isoform X1 [Homarus americanus]|uniref:uncharacterized protein LOC121875150 isoform X1 n=1 Tax=Homarus americanus TaxID=6706 RepID=UPI001C47A6E4|nr:uncharacterized protein LOC121875150 isoform X1 [Homarus americanus]